MIMDDIYNTEGIVYLERKNPHVPLNGPQLKYVKQLETGLILRGPYIDIMDLKVKEIASTLDTDPVGIIIHIPNGIFHRKNDLYGWKYIEDGLSNGEYEVIPDDKVDDEIFVESI
jgi:hypothetical protein